jgi:protein SCO1/2
VIIGAFAAYAPPRASAEQFKAVDITGVQWGQGFELTDPKGNKRTLADFRGKVVLLYFGYTSCPDMCPTTLALLGAAVKQLGGDADKVQGLFVTVDPKRDTPEVLARYVPSFYPTFLGLYGDAATTDRTVSEFKGYVHVHAPNAQGFYTVDHTGQVYAFDPAGRIRLLIRADSATPESIAHDVRLLLREAAG